MGILIDNIKQCESKIDDIRQKKLELNKKISNLTTIENELIYKKNNYPLICYLDEETREDLLDQAKKFHYSLDEIKKLEAVFINWNPDVINDEATELIMKAEKFIDLCNETISPEKKESKQKTTLIKSLGEFFFHDKGDIDDN